MLFAFLLEFPNMHIAQEYERIVGENTDKCFTK